MNKEELTSILTQTIKKRKPIKVYLKDDDKSLYEYFDIMHYNKDKNRYECNYGSIPMNKMSKILSGDKSVEHIRLEAVCE